MRYREIPETAVEVQPGLWANRRTITMGSLSMTTYDLYSAEGYCVYILANSMDENGNLLPAEQRVYYVFINSVYETIEEVNSSVVSVPYVPGYEIASTGGNGNHEVM